MAIEYLQSPISFSTSAFGLFPHQQGATSTTIVCTSATITLAPLFPLSSAWGSSLTFQWLLSCPLQSSLLRPPEGWLGSMQRSTFPLSIPLQRPPLRSNANLFPRPLRPYGMGPHPPCQAHPSHTPSHPPTSGLLLALMTHLQLEQGGSSSRYFTNC